YTLIIPGSADSAASPGGASIGTVTVAAGAASFSGMLADGTPVAQKVPLSKDGLWPLYAPLYGGNGSLFSRVTFADQPEDDFSGALTWTKPAQAAAKYYSNPFSASTVVTGS